MSTHGDKLKKWLDERELLAVIPIGSKTVQLCTHSGKVHWEVPYDDMVKLDNEERIIAYLEQHMPAVE